MDVICFDPPRYRACGDTGFLIEYGDQISPVIHGKVMSMTRALEKNPIPGVITVIPSYTTILLLYSFLQTNPDILTSAVSDLTKELDNMDFDPPRLVEIPVCYEGEFALDMDHVAESRGLNQQEVIHIHSRPEYLIYMVGFTPGFAFLGGLDPKIHTPRLETPRTSVPRGSVGIANNQTGIYSIDSPGGWQIIGRTPLTLFAPERPEPFLYRPGDRIKFIPVSEPEFRTLRQGEKD